MLIHSDPNNTNSIVCHLIIVRYSMKTSHWYFPWATTLHLCNMTGRGEKLQQQHCYHPFSDSRDIYLTKNHYENYSPKMVPIAKIWGSGSWTIGHIYFVACVSKIEHILSVIRYTIYGAVCFQFTHFPCDDWENIYFVLLSSSNRKYELSSLFTIVCAVCLFIFLWIHK